VNRLRDQGLGLSLLVYVGALLGGLFLFVAPVLWAYGPTEYPNPPLPKYDITSSRPLFDQHKQVPLARLKREDIVDQKALASINAKPDKPEKPKREASERTSRSARTAYAQAHDDDASEHRPRRSVFPFSLF
jgi:hypothetical protein